EGIGKQCPFPSEKTPEQSGYCNFLFSSSPCEIRFLIQDLFAETIMIPHIENINSVHLRH
ncbi:MAG: hypothetical protein IJR54_08720, partial [Oscillibacter sp.]|nr:hypothetical protein [Oscillibacter sp.]